MKPFIPSTRSGLHEPKENYAKGELCHIDHIDDPSPIIPIEQYVFA